MASDYEGFGLVVAEAMILGKAIITSDCTGPTELLGYGKYGVVIEKGNVVMLKDAIKNFLIKEEIKKNFEERALMGSDRFNKDTVINEINKLFA